MALFRVTYRCDSLFRVKLPIITSYERTHGAFQSPRCKGPSEVIQAHVKEASKIFGGVLVEKEGRRRRVIEFHPQGAFFEFENKEGTRITVIVSRYCSVITKGLSSFFVCSGPF